VGTNGHVNRGEGAVRDGAPQGAGEGEAGVEVDALGRLWGGQGDGRGSHRDDISKLRNEKENKG
jgi:hypothetical protein